jgi:NarL family two-component system response regulator LiaR
VLRLLAQGHSNQQIADALFISLPTTKVHVHSILTKLNVESRTAAAAFALTNGLA